MRESLLVRTGTFNNWTLVSQYEGPESPMHVVHGNKVTFLPNKWLIGDTITVMTMDLITLEQTSRVLGPVELAANKTGGTKFTSRDGILYIYQRTNTGIYDAEIWSFNPETDLFSFILKTRNSNRCPIVRTETHFVTGHGVPSGSGTISDYLLINSDTLATILLGRGSSSRSVESTLVEKDGLVYNLYGDPVVAVEIHPSNATLVNLDPSVKTSPIRGVEGGLLGDRFFSFGTEGIVYNHKCFGYYDFKVNEYHYIDLVPEKKQPWASSRATCFVFDGKLWVIPGSQSSKHQIWTYHP